MAGYALCVAAVLGMNYLVYRFFDGRNHYVSPGAVWDGDSFHVQDDLGQITKVQLACVDAPEKSQAWGLEATDYLKSFLTDNRKVDLVIYGQDQWGRKVAEVYVQQGETRINVNAQMAAAGFAHVDPRHSHHCPANFANYQALEQTAQATKKGVWSGLGKPTAPWEWRKLKW